VDAVVREQIREFVIQNLMLGGDTGQLDDSGSLMDLGILDSVGVLDLVGFIESTWSIDVADDELVRDNLDSIDNLVGFIERKVA
jgi:acyl carrier protein